MTGYNCKYAPVEILAGFGENCRLINNEAENFDYSISRLHQNMCTHAKAMLEDIHSGNYKELLFVNCCDSPEELRTASAGKILIFLILLMFRPATRNAQ